MQRFGHCGFEYDGSKEENLELANSRVGRNGRDPLTQATGLISACCKARDLAKSITHFKARHCSYYLFCSYGSCAGGIVRRNLKIRGTVFTVSIVNTVVTSENLVRSLVLAAHPKWALS